MLEIKTVMLREAEKEKEKKKKMIKVCLVIKGKDMYVDLYL